MEAQSAAGKTVTTEIIKPEKRKKIGRTTYIVRRYFTGGRNLEEAINEVIMNEAKRSIDDRMKKREVSGYIAAAPVTERRTEK